MRLRLTFLFLFGLLLSFFDASALEDFSEEKFSVSRKIKHKKIEGNSLGKILPEEIWIKIISFLNTQDKYSLSQTCRFFNRLSKDHSLWKDLFKLENKHLTKLKETPFPLFKVEVLNKPTPITLVSLQKISYLRNLQALHLKSLEELDLETLGSITSSLTCLTDLRVRSPQLDNAALLFISSNNNLRILHFQSAKLSENSSSIFQKLTALQDLSLWKTQGIPFGALTYLTNLTSLDIPRVNMVDGDLEFCSHLTKLTDLRLAGNNVSDLSFVHLTCLKKLKILHLGSTHISEEGLKQALPSFPDLEELSLINISLKNAENPIDFLMFINLVILDLSSAHVTNSHLKTLGRLKQLDLYDVPLDNNSLEIIKGLTTLSYLSLSRGVNEDAVQDLAQALPNLKQIFYPHP